MGKLAFTILATLASCLGVHMALANSTVTRLGDNGPARKAVIDGPDRLAFDQAGDLFVYESPDGRPGFIRKIDASTKVITTIAAECEKSAMHLPAEGCFHPISQMHFNAAGELLFSEFTHNRLRSLDLRSNKFSTIAGTGELGFEGEGGPAIKATIGDCLCFAIDRSGNIFICAKHRILRIDAVNATIATVAGTGSRGSGGDNGPALLAEFDFTQSMAVSSDGELYVADNGSHRIRRINLRTGIIETIAGTGAKVFSGEGFDGEGIPARQAELFTPASLALDRTEKNLYFVNAEYRICRVDLATGRIYAVAGDGTPGSGGDGGLAVRSRVDAYDLAIGPNGDLFFADWQNNRIRRIDIKTGLITTIAGNGRPHRGPPVYQ